MKQLVAELRKGPDTITLSHNPLLLLPPLLLLLQPRQATSRSS
jgi:hypothetical protein